MIVRFVDIGRIVNHHCLSILVTRQYFILLPVVCIAELSN
jgi:hypothetical protein